MHLYCQWTTDPPRDWIRYGSVEKLLKVKPKPKPHVDHVQGRLIEEFDNQPGWVHALNVQGIVFSDYDHYVVEQLDEVCRITVWNDDIQDWADRRMAIRIDCLPIAVVNGILNTRMSRTHWSTPDFVEQWTKGGRVRLDFPWHDWSEFVEPTGRRYHGIWTSQEMHVAHRRIRAIHRWREWQ